MKNFPPSVTVGAVALFDSDKRVLLGQRASGSELAGFWEFPGGKQREGETIRMAACREVAEELALHVEEEELTPFGTVNHRYERFLLRLHLFVCREWIGVPSLIVHRRIRWVPIHRLPFYSMPPADQPLVKKLLIKYA